MNLNQQKGTREAHATHAGGVDQMGAPGSSGGNPLKFYVGLHQPGDAQHFERCCISIHRLATRKKPVECADVIVDSGAFTKLAKHGAYPEPVEVYAGQLHRLWTQGVVQIIVAAAQDYMCEPFMLAKTGLTVAEHQRLTVERYDALLDALTALFCGPPPFPIMPVLQGFTIPEYLSHIEQYGDRLKFGMWVGVGSVCKRQGDPTAIEDLLLAIKEVRPDLRLHGFWRQADLTPKRARPATALQRRQHGVELRRPHGRTKRERLARGRHLHPASPHSPPRTTETVLRMRA
jgi:hypothetical protein